MIRLKGNGSSALVISDAVSYNICWGLWYKYKPVFTPVGGNVQISKTVMMVQIVDLKKELLNLRSSL
nr:hypothetical protein [Tanacetum cinerariifolium]